MPFYCSVYFESLQTFVLILCFLPVRIQNLSVLDVPNIISIIAFVAGERDCEAIVYDR